MKDAELDRLLDQWKTPAPSAALRRDLRAALPHRSRGRLFGVPVRWIVALTVAAGVVAIATSFNGSIGEFGGSADLPNGPLYVRATSLVDPPVAALRWWLKGGGGSVGETSGGALKGSVYIHDRAAQLFYGYEYVAEPLGGGQYKIAIIPLQASTIQKGPFVVSGQPAPLPSVPAPQIVTDGQPIDIDVYRNASERAYIRLQVSANPFSKRRRGAPAESQRNVLHTRNSKLFRDGILIASGQGSSASGNTLWFHLPGEGRYLIALDPTANPAFVAAGQVNGKTLELHADNHTYRLESDRPLAPGPPRPVYVFHDSGFESSIKPGDSEPMIGSAGPACAFNGACRPK